MVHKTNTSKTKTQHNMCWTPLYANSYNVNKAWVLLQTTRFQVVDHVWITTTRHVQVHITFNGKRPVAYKEMTEKIWPVQKHGPDCSKGMYNLLVVDNYYKDNKQEVYRNDVCEVLDKIFFFRLFQAKNMTVNRQLLSVIGCNF